MFLLKIKANFRNKLRNSRFCALRRVPLLNLFHSERSKWILALGIIKPLPKSPILGPDMNIKLPTSDTPQEHQHGKSNIGALEGSITF